MPHRELQKQYGMTTNRATPEWGKAIFSDLCVILRPQASAASIMLESYFELDFGLAWGAIVAWLSALGATPLSCRPSIAFSGAGPRGCV